MTRKEDEIDNLRPGVLNKEQTNLLAKNGFITHLDGNNIDSSSFDLHLSDQAWMMEGSIKPDRYTNCSTIIGDYKKKSLNLNDLQTFHRRTTYIVRIEEGLKLPSKKKFSGRATGKSSIGRLDVLTRLMVDKCASYDKFDDDYNGDLYLEVTPITFPIKVKKGISLSQLRLFRGTPELSEINKEDLELFGGLILDENYDSKPSSEVSELRVNLLPDPKTGFSAYRARERNNKDLEIDLTKPNGYYTPEEFWEQIPYEKDKLLEIIPEAFYILRSKERFKLPNDVAVYCQAISETLGELRIHYAGFVHPCFGSQRKEGTPVIFEVRGHNVKTYLRDGETLAHIKFYRMSKPAEVTTDPSDYENQELTLSKYFKNWGQT